MTFGRYSLKINNKTKLHALRKHKVILSTYAGGSKILSKFKISITAETATFCVSCRKEG